MGWLSKIFERSKRKERHNHANYEEGANLPPNSGDVSSENENEGSSRAIRESLNLEPPPGYGDGNMYQPVQEYWEPKCYICKQNISTNPAGYLTHTFWNLKCCPSHMNDGTPWCYSCERMEPRDNRYTDLDDGQKHCSECMDTAIMDTNECQPLYIEIQIFYRRLNMKLRKQIPLQLVERRELNNSTARWGEKEIRGLCLTERQNLRQSKSWTGNRTQHYKVKAILILFGLPRLLTGTILAHEMMHAWLRLEGYPSLNLEVEEGMCQVMAYMWLEAELSHASDSNFASNAIRRGKRRHFERTLGEFFLQQFESSMVPVYRDGFRAGQQAVNKYGLQGTLHHIRKTGNFPF